jgi:hypothetical protein
MQKFLTGFFAIPGTSRLTRTHVVYADDKKTLCAAKMRPDMVFQVCAHGVHAEYVTCAKCRLTLKGKWWKKVTNCGTG